MCVCDGTRAQDSGSDPSNNTLLPGLTLPLSLWVLLCSPNTPFQVCLLALGHSFSLQLSPASLLEEMLSVLD